ncbi:MAG: GAF domain-containing protein [Anaerolineales bacterium]|nr:GAF domain-containing protein [Anaerolineales bacterium]
MKRNPAPSASTLNDDQFRILTETTASALFMFQGTRFCYVNPATERLTGYPRAELLKMNFYDLFPAGMKRSMREWGLKLQRGEEVVTRGVYPLIVRNGEECWVDLSMGVVNFKGKPAGLGTAFDISERKRVEILQDAVYRIAQAADRSISLEDLFPAVHRIIAEVMPAKNFYIALYDRADDKITYPYYVDEYDRPTNQARSARGLTGYVLRTGKPLLCDSATHAALERAGEIELIGTPSPIWLGVPLIIDAHVIGAMVVQDYEDPDAFSERELRVLDFVSSQVAMAVNRKRAEDVLRENESRNRQRADELTALYETTRDVATQRDPKALMQAIVDRAASLLNSAGGSIYLFNEERNEVELIVAHGFQGYVGTRLVPGEGLVGRVLEDLEPMIVPDYRTWEFRSAKFDAESVTAVMAVPMLYSGETVGVLSVNEIERDDETPLREYRQSDVELLTFFAGAAASAVHNSRLFQETRRRLIELEALYQASLAAAQIHSLKAVAQRIVDALDQLMRWQGSIWVIDIEHQCPTLLAYGGSNLTGKSLKDEIARVDSLLTSFDVGIVGLVCQTGQPVRTGDAPSNPYYLEITPGMRSELAVPLKVGGRTIGCINVESAEPDAFSEHDERLLTTIANQAAIAIENARLFDEARRRAVRQAALNTIITASTRAGTGLDALLNMALEQVLQALGLDIGALWLEGTLMGVQRVAARGVPSAINTMMNNAAASGRFIFSRTLVVTDWVGENHQFSEMFVSLGMRSAVIVPLQTDGRRIGGLAVAAPEPRQWTVEETALVEAVGREVGAAVERARLFEETQDRLAELEVINKVSTALRLAQSQDEMLTPLLDETLGTLGVEAGSIWLYDPADERLKQVIGKGWCSGIAHLKLERGEDIPGMVFAEGVVYFTRDLHEDPLTTPAIREIIPPGWSVMAVPILAEQETIGVFLVSARLPRELNSGDARLAITLTEMAGNALQRMRLYEQTEDHAVELEGRVAERTAELMDALKKAQEADRLKSEFIANVNHELRTPLTNLVLYHQMLHSQPTVKTEERLDVIGRELQRLRTLIEDLLNLSRLDLGQVAFNVKPHDLNLLVRTLVDDRRSLAVERGLELVIDLAPTLPPVWVDEPRIMQAISNLLTNALLYTQPGGQVFVCSGQATMNQGDWVTLGVRDTGPGISDEDLPHLFERFYRGKASLKSGAPGTGLGLAIVKQVVEGHSGRIEVGQGPDGRGSVFTLWLPVNQKEETKK